MNHLPSLLQDSLEKVLENIQRKTLRDSSHALSQRYRAGEGISSEDLHYAYLTTRLPATFSAITHVLKNLEGKYTPRSLLDLGSGPGTAAWAADSYFGPFEQIHLIEKDPSFIDLGKTLAQGHPSLSQAKWILQDLKEGTYPQSDLVILSYAFGEFQNKEVIEKAWKSATLAFVFIEPGTPRGFQHLLQVRDQLISLGGYLLAPCPHHLACPLAMHKSQWCHFAARVPRSPLHRYAKGGSLPYEDEKFCYLIATRDPFQRASRILHSPLKRSGHVHLELCTPTGLKSVVISKRDSLYKEARKASWGDSF